MPPDSWCVTPQGSMVKAAVDCLGAPRQGHHCESHLVCELPFPMTGTILSTILCSLGQRSLGPQSGWVGGRDWAQAWEEVQREWRKRLFNFRICLQLWDMSKGRRWSPGALGIGADLHWAVQALGEPGAGNASLVQCSRSLGHTMFPWA